MCLGLHLGNWVALLYAVTDSRATAFGYTGEGGDSESGTGWGLSTYLTDNSHPLLIVNSENQTVSLCEEGSEDAPYTSFSFEDYIHLVDVSRETLSRESVSGASA
jgi:hypothetical protein